MKRARLTILSILLTSGCTNHGLQEEPSVGRLVGMAECSLEEVREKNERHELRERLRASGLRVCEEGEWPQQWGEKCNTCWCDIGEVRICTMAHCRSKDDEIMRMQASSEAGVPPRAQRHPKHASPEREAPWRCANP